MSVICSDEIHSEILLGGSKHIPIAALDPEIANRTITLVAPSKTFNVPGLFCGFAIIPNPDLLGRYKRTVERMAMHVSSPGLVAAQVAFSGECDEWLEALRPYLTGNRDFLVGFNPKRISRDPHDHPGCHVPGLAGLHWAGCLRQNRRHAV